MTNPPAPTSWRWIALATLPALVLLACQASWPWPFFSDDAFISLRYAQRLLAGDGLTWTDGERVEGYSNLLWVLATATLGALGLDLVLAARLLGGALTVAALWLLACAGRPDSARTAASAALAPLLAASAQVVLGWTLGGLEGPMVLCWLAWGYSRLLRAHATEPDLAAWSPATLHRASVPFALLCWTRPDGPLWVAATGLSLGLCTVAHGLPTALVQALRFAALPFAAFALQLLGRGLYYGDVVPNTAHVKAEFDPAALPAGIDYLLAAAGAHLGLVLAAGAAVVLGLVRAATRAPALLLLVPILVWFAYLIAIGGDHFPGRRLWHGAIAPLALMATLRAGRAVPWPWSLALVVAASWNVAIARTDPQSHELRGEIWEWRGRAVGHALERAFGAQRPLLAVDAAGAVPYYSRLPALDMLGLCDRTIATTPTPAWLSTMQPDVPRPPGHLRGNGRYVMDRAPDLVLFATPPGLPLPVFASGCEIEDDARFLDGYRGVLVDLGDVAILPDHEESLVVPLWVRRDGACGVRTAADHLTIPAWLFAGHALAAPIVRRHQPPTSDAAAEARAAAALASTIRWFTERQAVAKPDAEGRLQLELRAPVLLSYILRPPPGTWSVYGEPSNPDVEIAPARVDATGAADVTLELRPRAGATLPVRLDRVVLRQGR